MSMTNYEGRFSWSMECNKSGSDASQADLESELFPKLVTLATEKFSAEMNKETGHWYRINSVSSKITAFKLLINYYGLRKYSVQGETSVFFDSDISDPQASHSPQLVAAIAAAVLAVAAAIMANPGIFLLIVLVVAFAISAALLINTLSGAIFNLGGNAGSLAITLGILALVGLAIYALFFTRTGRGAARRAYHGARRIYQRALPPARPAGKRKRRK